MKILNCYLFSVLNYGCESWTWHKAMRMKINAFEMWCYRRILKISWMDRVKNEEVLYRVQGKLHFMEDMIKRKMNYAGHVMRGSSGETHVNILEYKIEGTRKVEAPRRTWTKDMLEWTGRRPYELVKAEAGERESWKTSQKNWIRGSGKEGKNLCKCQPPIRSRQQPDLYHYIENWKV